MWQFFCPNICVLCFLFSVFTYVFYIRKIQKSKCIDHCISDKLIFIPIISKRFCLSRPMPQYTPLLSMTSFMNGPFSHLKMKNWSNLYQKQTHGEWFCTSKFVHDAMFNGECVNGTISAINYLHNLSKPLKLNKISKELRYL